MIRKTLLAFAAAAFAAVIAVGGPAQAAVIDLVENGDFEITTLPGAYGVGDGIAIFTPGPGRPWGINQATGWTISGYNFIFTPGSADTTGSDQGYQGVQVWGPGNEPGNTNGLTATSPTGGNFFAADGGIENGTALNGPISQTLHGLVQNQVYNLTFYWAAAQQFGPDYNGATTERWDVSVGDGSWLESYATPTYNNVSHGFSGWMQETFTFTAGASGDATLTFLAQGTPDGQPPFSLLDGVHLFVNVPDVPEPATWMMMMVGFGLIGGLLRSRKPADQRALRMQIV